MLYGGITLEFGKKLEKPVMIEAHSSIRLYDFDELTVLFEKNQVRTIKAFGAYNEDVLEHHKHMQLLVVSKKVGHYE